MRSGDRPGLQNRRVASSGVTGGFDPHSLPPLFVVSRLFAERAKAKGCGTRPKTVRWHRWAPMEWKNGAMIALLCLLTGCKYHESTVAVTASAVMPQCTIAAHSSGDDILVEVTIANHTSRPSQVLRWNLPSDGRMTTALFQVTRNGVPVEYRGIMVKRAVRPEDYILLPAGKALTATVPLLQAYDVRPNGSYTIKYSTYNPRLGTSTLDNYASDPVAIIKR